MKVIHCCFSSFYIDNYNYQENAFIRETVLQGHTVLVLASTESYDTNGKLCYLKPGQYKGNEGAPVIRLPYKKILTYSISRKMRSYPNVYKIINEFKPDVIYFHGICAWELLTIIKYKKMNPSVKVYLDSHTDFNNSAKNFISKYVLHFLFYRTIFRSSLKYIEKVFCISLETQSFVEHFYACPKSLIEYLPLGGIIYTDDEYKRKRQNTRAQYKLRDETLVFLQTGKFDTKKKLKESLESFAAIKNNSSVAFLIAGVIVDELQDELMELIHNDKRISFLGWKNAEKLSDLLCACDVYVQPGSQSATLQNSICARCVVIVDNVISHMPFVKGNGWLVSNDEELKQAFNECIMEHKNNTLIHRSKESLAIAEQLLDYKNQVKKFLN